MLIVFLFPILQNKPFVSLNLKSLDTKPCQDKLAKFRDLDSSTKHLLLAQRRPPPLPPPRSL